MATLGDAVGDERPLLLFWIVLIAASGCELFAFVLLVRAWRADTAELAYLGLFLHAFSLFPLLHGITLPGVLYGPNTATDALMFWTPGFALLVAAPLLVPVVGRRFRSWKLWVIASVVGTVLFGAITLGNTELLGFPAPGSRTNRLVAVGFFVAILVLSLRQLRLARIARRPAPLVVSIGLGLVAVAVIAPLGMTAWSADFWVAHLFDIGGVFIATAAGMLVYRRSGTNQKLLAPLLAVEPIAALEVGLEPAVAGFLGDIETKDESTRDHVARTSAVAILVAEELGLTADMQRRVGLVALLHDVGKIAIPDAILKKPGRLTDAEFEVMKTHAEEGARLVERSTVLVDLAPGIRHHHERIDGDGYPGHLSGERIPLEARVVAVCDAFDAMARTRHYRAGMEVDRVRAILREHSGSQWDSAVVDALMRVLDGRPHDAIPAVSVDSTVCSECVPPHLVVVAASNV